MKKALLVFVVLTIISFGCNKSDDNLTWKCIQVRYAGKGCLEVIQVLTPVESKWVQSWDAGGDSGFAIRNCIAVESLDDQYKNVDSFSIKIRHVKLVGLITTDSSVPKYLAEYSICPNN